ncbi:pyridoxamine 5'-phosphate oxidase [Parachlamydia sp. AcF125]|uniref:pyridoxamine 5'-phosphate oxidase n=1 Tax=Parachlamydia sp. AcF125 TaxID=2795736 RepID=UPI001BC9AE64|nr:pyridoxamine 5'-phosphate oxidase [Parachlamydia sp. AcF125]MBS4167565.1 Pyridoxine/pyridoxamine 5'-phosphate oxidase [Parachlamydia sp. AcF125]
MGEKKTLRKEYSKSELRREGLSPDPFNQFQIWFREAINEEAVEPNAMTLSTTSLARKPSSRIVLLKYFDHRGFVFFTNLESRKSRELRDNPFAAINFFWRSLERQVNIEGSVVLVSSAESFSYFSKRPRGSQIGAWASKQDAELNSRDELEDTYKQLVKQYAGQPIPLPPFWGGFRLIPTRFEFWQGRANRLHDRFEYRAYLQNEWEIRRLSP